MEVRQCDFCRAPYHSYGSKLCPECMIKLDEDFVKIRDYLYDHDRAGVEEVSQATGVTRKTIIHLLKEERLIAGDENGAGCGILTCETCRKPINTGRICADCKKEVLSAIQESIGPVIRKTKPPPIQQEEENFKGIAKLQLKGKR